MAYRAVYESVDGVRMVRNFESIKMLRRFIERHVGEDCEIAAGYAVAADGVGTVTVGGISLYEALDRLAEFDVPELEPEKCDECGRECCSSDGICFECQCTLHAIGAYDMDGNGWRV